MHVIYGTWSRSEESDHKCVHSVCQNSRGVRSSRRTACHCWSLCTVQEAREILFICLRGFSEPPAGGLSWRMPCWSELLFLVVSVGEVATRVQSDSRLGAVPAFCWLYITHSDRTGCDIFILFHLCFVRIVCLNVYCVAVLFLSRVIFVLFTEHDYTADFDNAELESVTNIIYKQK